MRPFAQSGFVGEHDDAPLAEGFFNSWSVSVLPAPGHLLKALTNRNEIAQA
jgi:hypothetical protein